MRTMTRYRFFGGLLGMQARWLNRMAARGYRLLDTGRLRYTFVPAEPRSVEYAVEYVGDLGRKEADAYRAFLEEMGYRVWIKPINLNWSVGKVTIRPSADGGIRPSTSGSTYNRELFLVEKTGDGNAFALHTTLADRIAYTRRLRRPALWLLLFSLVLAFVLRQWLWLIFAGIALIPLLAAQIELWQLQREAKTHE